MILSFRPQIYDEKENDQILNDKYFVWKNYTLGKWGSRKAFNQNSLMKLFNGDRRIMHCVTLRVCPDWFQLWWLLPFGLVIVVLVPLLVIVTLWSHRSCLFPKLVLPTSGCWVGPIGLWDLHSMRICETRLRMGSSGRIQFGRVNAGVFTMCRFRSSAQIGYCWSNLGAL